MDYRYLLHHARARVFPQSDALQWNLVVIKNVQARARAFNTLQQGSVAMSSGIGLTHSNVFWFGSWNVETLKGKELELMGNQCSVACLQEVKYIGEKARFISHGYKLFYMGKMANINGVRIVVQ